MDSSETTTYKSMDKKKQLKKEVLLLVELLKGLVLRKVPYRNKLIMIQYR